MKGTVQTAAIIGVDVVEVEVSVEASSGVNTFTIDGLPAASVAEARVRVRHALVSAGGMPPGRVAASMSRPDVRKAGTGFDLPIALAILVAGGRLPADALADTLVVGELALDGRVRSVRGILPAVLAAKAAGQEGGDRAPGERRGGPRR